MYEDIQLYMNRVRMRRNDVEIKNATPASYNLLSVYNLFDLPRVSERNINMHILQVFFKET